MKVYETCSLIGLQRDKIFKALRANGSHMMDGVTQAVHSFIVSLMRFFSFLNQRSEKKLAEQKIVLLTGPFEEKPAEEKVVPLTGPFEEKPEDKNLEGEAQPIQTFDRDADDNQTDFKKIGQDIEATLYLEKFFPLTETPA